jgi:ribonuclease P protein component
MGRVQHRLTQERDFQKVRRRGKSFFSPYFRLSYHQNQLARSRYAVAVGIRVSKKATERNRLKRRVREAVRVRLGSLKPGYDIVFSLRPAAMDATGAQMRLAVHEALRKSQLTSS